jgi:hypothetical protein
MRINLREESKEAVARWFVSLRARTPVDEQQPGGGESGPPSTMIARYIKTYSALK